MYLVTFHHSAHHSLPFFCFDRHIDGKQWYSTVVSTDKVAQLYTFKASTTTRLPVYYNYFRKEFETLDYLHEFCLVCTIFTCLGTNELPGSLETNGITMHLLRDA